MSIPHRGTFSRRSLGKRFTVVTALLLGFSALAAETAPNPAPDPTESNILKLTSRILERSHYSQHPFDEEMSRRFLDRYIDTLDAFHLYFFQSDLQEFEKQRESLNELTLRKGDATPGHTIFARLLERMAQRTSFALELLKTNKFDFNGRDRYSIDRKNRVRPKDLDDAKEMWRQYLRYEYLEEKLNKKKPDEITKTLTSRYNRLLKSFKDFSPDEVFELWVNALSHAYDPHTDYMGKATVENFAINMKLSLFGIGALLQSEETYCTIRELVPEGPAAKSKQIKPKDKIIAVAQGTKEPVDVVGLKLQKIVEMIRGPKGTEVRLTIIPVDAPDPSVRKVVTLVREEVKLEDQEAKARIVDLPEEGGKNIRLGLIELPSFYEDFESKRGKGKSTTADVLRLLKKLNQEQVQGIVLDLRRNGGGALTEAINLTGLFIRKGPVVQTKDPDGRINVDYDTDPSVAYDGPLIILTSRFSASASEILAGALQDYGRALVVGDKSTHGKGTVQSLLPLQQIMEENRLRHQGDPGALKITIRKFYRASGSSTQLKGVIPDIILPSINNYAEVGEGALENPLPWDEVPSADYEKLNRVQPYLAELKKRSNNRVSSQKDFAYLREDIDQFRKILADKTVSLNEQERLKEKQELEARNEARKKERKTRRDMGEKLYEITLKNVDSQGLPAPSKKTNEVSTAEIHAGDESDEGDKAPSSDSIALEEAKQILKDYVTLYRQPLQATSVRR